MDAAAQQFDAVVIGAGFAGMHMLKTLRDTLGLKVRVYEAGENRRRHLVLEPLPGRAMRFRFVRLLLHLDKQLLQEWNWSERYPQQPEIMRYMEHVAARHDLKRDIQFNTRVTGGRIRHGQKSVARATPTRGSTRRHNS